MWFVFVVCLNVQGESCSNHVDQDQTSPTVCSSSTMFVLYFNSTYLQKMTFADAIIKLIFVDALRAKRDETKLNRIYGPTIYCTYHSNRVSVCL